MDRMRTLARLSVCSSAPSWPEQAPRAVRAGHTKRTSLKKSVKRCGRVWARVTMLVQIESVTVSVIVIVRAAPAVPVITAVVLLVLPLS